MCFNRHKVTIILIFLLFSFTTKIFALPPGFVYLRDIDPSIDQELRYGSQHNFLGRPVHGYENIKQCILTRETALALKEVQAELRKSSLSLKVYDCYRPQRAVNDFIQWSTHTEDQVMKKEFYPRVNKTQVFVLGYVAEKSGHSRGSTLDLTLIPQPQPSQESYRPGQKLVPCYASYALRFRDNSLNMGSGYDCLDEAAHVDYQNLKPLERTNRKVLSQVMIKHGFKPYSKEWWHFTYKNEPYPQTYFDFIN